MVSALSLCQGPNVSWHNVLMTTWGNDGGQPPLPNPFFNGLVIKHVKIHQQITSLSVLENYSPTSHCLAPCEFVPTENGYEVLPAYNGGTTHT